MILIIDADPIVYRSGFAAEKNAYHVVAEDGTGKLYERTFHHKEGESHSAQIGDWLNRYKLTVLTKEKIVLPEPVSHVLHLVKQELSGIKSAVEAEFKRKVTRQHILISGPGNYRELLAKQRPYKGNRDPEHKPYHYQAIRDFIVDKGGRVVMGREADDEASIMAREAARQGTPFCVATIDKDLDQIPGKHFDYRQKVFYDVSEWHARRWFWIQTLSGDPTDNIPGCYKVGPQTAKLLVEDLFDKHDGDELKIWEDIVDAYRRSTTKSGCPYTVEQAEEVALETARLVYMQHEPNELWNPPGVPMGTMKGDIDD